MTAQVTTAHLIKILGSANQRTNNLINDLTEDQLIGPRLPIINPILWEIGHVAWFHEFFVLRQEYGYSAILERGDQLYDSIAVAHHTRWDLNLYDLKTIKEYMERVFNQLVDRLEPGMASERDSYLYQFTTFHEDMHNEAYTWARQTLGYPQPSIFSTGYTALSDATINEANGDALIPGGRFKFGAEKTEAFVFDNEKWAHDVKVKPFKLARTPVTCGEFAEFVEDGGYEKENLWSKKGLRWLKEVGSKHPVYWLKDKSGGWKIRIFDQWFPLVSTEPVVHVNWYEAEAFCCWAGRRLPTEIEWEFAASMCPVERKGLQKCRYPWGNQTPTEAHVNMDGVKNGCTDVKAHSAGDNAWGCRQMIGNVWEWTLDTFRPFKGFAPDDYKEYSEPLFGSTKILRGGSWATRSRYVTAKYRNYFAPERRDIFAGFRTCALKF